MHVLLELLEAGQCRPPASLVMRPLRNLKTRRTLDDDRLRYLDERDPKMVLYDLEGARRRERVDAGVVNGKDSLLQPGIVLFSWAAGVEPSQ